MLLKPRLWRWFDGNDGSNGGGGGGASAGQTGGGAAGPAAAPIAGASASAPAEPPVPPSTPQIDPQEYAALQVKTARLQARVTYPQADAALLETLSDPASIDAVAKRTHELALQAQAPSAGAPVPPTNATTSVEGEEQRRVRELQYKVRQRMRPGMRGGRTMLEPWEAEEAVEAFFRQSWNGHMGHRAQGRGNVSAPPSGAPAAAQSVSLPAPGRAF